MRKILFICTFLATAVLHINAQYFQGFEETTTRPSCWTGATFSNKLSSAIAGGVKTPLQKLRQCESGAGASGLGAPTPNWLRTAAFTLSGTTTSEWVSLWFRTGGYLPLQNARYRIQLENQGTLALTAVSSYIVVNGVYDTIWTNKKFNFPPVVAGNYKLVFEVSTGSTRLEFDAVESSVNINGGPASSASISISSGTNPACGSTVNFASAFVNPQATISYDWYLNLNVVASNVTTWSCDTLQPCDSVYMIMQTGTPCYTAYRTNVIKFLACGSLSITGLSSHSFCAYPASNFNITFNTSIPGTHTYTTQLSNINSKTFPASPVSLGNATTSPISCTLPSALSTGKYYVRIESNGGERSTNVDSITVSGFSNSATQTNISCAGAAGGAVNITVAGATTPIQYSWSNGVTSKDISSVTAGTYNLTITDNNSCSQTYSYIITQLTALTQTASISNVLCNGSNNGAIDVTVAGGTLAYTYSWSNAALSQDLNSKTAGNYNLTITDSKGCTSTASYSITQPTSSLSISTGVVTNINCNSTATGAVNITIAGGTSAYTYIWNTGATTQSITGRSNGTYSVNINDANNCNVSASYTITQPVSALSQTNTVTNVLCYSGSTGDIDVTAAGGTSPYNYSWNNGVTTKHTLSLVSGTYTVTITDTKTCTITASIALTQPTATLSIPGVTAAVQCNNTSSGAITITPNGGTTAYTYSWNNGATTKDISTLTTGTYTLTTTDKNACTVSASYSITQPTALLHTSSITDVLVYGGSNGAINISVNGGTSPYTYSWNSGSTAQDISSATAGNYSIVITDNKGCSVSSIYSISEPGNINISPTISNVLCNSGSNGSINISISGGQTPYTFSWSNGVTSKNTSALTAGSYSLAVTDQNGSTRSVSYTVSQPNAIGQSGSIKNISCFGGNNGEIDATASGGTSPYNYSWNNGATTKNALSLTSGTYTLTITDFNSCSITASFTTTQPTAALSQTNTITNVPCYGASSSAIAITTSGGTSPYTYSWSNGALTTNVASLTAGSYNLSITDKNACMLSGSFTITQPASTMSLSNVTSTNILCNGGNNGSISITPAGGLSPYSYSWNNGQSSSSNSSLTTGSYTVTVTDQNACTSSYSLTVTQPSVALIIAATTSTISCNGGNNASINLNSNGGTLPYTYSWSIGATSQNISSLSAATYSVTLTDVNGCTKSSSYNITQPSLLSESAVVTDVAVNGENTGAINLTISGGSFPYTYSWSNANTNQDISSVSAGTYDIIITDTKGCNRTASYTITEPGSINITPVITHVLCNGASNGAISISAAGGATPYTFKWSTNATTQNVSSLSAGAYIVTVNDNDGVVKISNFIISQSAVIAATSSISNVTCKGGSNGSISVTASGGTSPYTYQWSVSSTANPLSDISAGSFIITITDSKACNFSASYTVTESPLPGVELGFTKYICQGENTILNAGFGFTNYTWKFKGSTIFSGDYPYINASDSGKYYVFVQDASGCNNKDSVVVTAYKLPIPTIAGNTSVCSASSTTLNASGGTSYLWSTTENTASINIAPTSNSNYTVIVNKAYTGRSCSISKVIAISVNALPIPTLTSYTTSVYAGQQNVTYSLTAKPAHTYNWTTTGGTIDGTNSGSDIIIDWGTDVAASSGFFITDTDFNTGCSSTTFYLVTIYVPQPISIIYTADNVGCVSDNDGSIIINDVTGGVKPYSYNWDNGKTTRNHTNLSIGDYTLTITDTRGDSLVTSFTIAKTPGFEYSINETESLKCYGDLASLEIVPNEIGSYIFNWSNGNTDANISGLSAGSYSATVTNQDGCENPKSIIINAINKISLQLITIQPVCPLDNSGSIAAIISGITEPYSLIWSNGNDSQMISNLPPDEYSLTVTDQNGCSVDTTIQIDAEKEICIDVPTAFSPNGDGINDVWNIKDLNYYYPDCIIEVYNRWGMLLFSSKGYSTPWNGFDKKYKLPFDSYHYIIDLNVGYLPLTGQVTILR